MCRNKRKYESAESLSFSRREGKGKNMKWKAEGAKKQQS